MLSEFLTRNVRVSIASTTMIATLLLGLWFSESSSFRSLYSVVLEYWDGWLLERLITDFLAPGDPLQISHSRSPSSSSPRANATISWLLDDYYNGDEWRVLVLNSVIMTMGPPLIIMPCALLSRVKEWMIGRTATSQRCSLCSKHIKELSPLRENACQILIPLLCYLLLFFYL